MPEKKKPCQEPRLRPRSRRPDESAGMPESFLVHPELLTNDIVVLSIYISIAQYNTLFLTQFHPIALRQVYGHQK